MVLPDCNPRSGKGFSEPGPQWLRALDPNGRLPAQISISNTPLQNLTHTTKMNQFTHFVVIGAGPAGLLAAAGLANRGLQVDVYEGRPSLNQKPEDSYPIGLNYRGLRSIERVAGSQFSERLKKEGRIVDSWDIMAGGFKVAQVESGACYSHTRFAVTQACYDAATGGASSTLASDKSSSKSASSDTASDASTEHTADAEHASRVRVHFNKRLSSFDPIQKILTFADGATITLDSNTGLIAGDGVWSQVRKALVNLPEKPVIESVIPWGQRFRVMFMDKGAPADWNPNVHYIWTGVYAAVTGYNAAWSVVPGCKDGDVHASWFDSNEATPENIEGLKQYLKERIPALKPEGALANHFSDEELKAFFTRRIFSGALTHVTAASYGSYCVLLGDAAHGLFPATGEGVNSALDDVTCLMDCFDSWSNNNTSLKTVYDVIKPANAKTFLDSYAATRQPAIDALHALAKDIMTMQNGTGQEKAVHILGSIFGKWSSKKGVEKETDLRYGPASKKMLLPYEEIVARHAEQVKGARKWAARFVSPFGEIKKSAFSSGLDIEAVAKAVRAK